jgi:hypothetical protein
MTSIVGSEFCLRDRNMVIQRHMKKDVKNAICLVGNLDTLF